MSAYRNLKMKDILLSDDGTTVIFIDPETGEDEQMAREDYEAVYGEIDEEAIRQHSADAEAEKAKSAEDAEAAEADSDEPEIPKEDLPYEQHRWRSLRTLKNHIKRSERKEMLKNLDEVFPLQAQRAYYSSLLEFTYAAGDVSWANFADVNAYGNGIYPVQKMLGDYNMRDSHLDCIEDGYNMRLTGLYNEMLKWSSQVGFGRVRQEDREKIYKFFSDVNKRAWVRKRLKPLLEDDGELYDIGQVMAMYYNRPKPGRKKKAE